jgi:hypothetical protein
MVVRQDAGIEERFLAALGMTGVGRRAQNTFFCCEARGGGGHGAEKQKSKTHLILRTWGSACWTLTDYG